MQKCIFENKNSKLCFDTVPQTAKLRYPEVEIITENVIFNDNTVQTNKKHPIKIRHIK